MESLNIISIITDLEAAGLSQAEIGKQAGGMAQSTVSDLKTGKLKSIRYERGKKLVRLHRKYCKQAA